MTMQSVECPNSPQGFLYPALYRQINIQITGYLSWKITAEIGCHKIPIPAYDFVYR